MKMNALVIAGIALLSTNAFATKARIEAMGPNANLYIKDSRNVFRNAATVNSNKNYLVTEWGTAAKDDTSAAPRAEGGFFREAGSLAYGLYLGDEGTRNTTRVDNSTAAGFLGQDNALDLFIGGDAGLQWGARVHYANSKNETGTASAKRTNSAISLGLGMVMGEAEGYVNVDLSDKSKGNGTNASYEFKTKPSFVVGGSYNWSGYVFFAEANVGKTETKTTSTATEKTNNYMVGAGRVMDVTPTARVFGNLAVAMNKTDVAASKTTETLLPATFGFETDATSWLALRGSVTQNVLLNNRKVETKTAPTSTTKSTKSGTTSVDAGASLTFGKLALDGSVGVKASGTLNTDNLLSRVGVTYSF